uniref:(northern house mosquito) hypothetical protein n=1 Tax=Culex pipiens TaxID=7175 RepID=A0A8D8G1E5_CULPI
MFLKAHCRFWCLDQQHDLVGLDQEDQQRLRFVVRLNGSYFRGWNSCHKVRTERQFCRLENQTVRAVDANVRVVPGSASLSGSYSSRVSLHRTFLSAGGMVSL